MFKYKLIRQCKYKKIIDSKIHMLQETDVSIVNNMLPRKYEKYAYHFSFFTKLETRKLYSQSAILDFIYRYIFTQTR